MTEISNNKKRYDLEDRTFRFARDVRVFTGQLPKTPRNHEDGKQVIRSSGSIGANYIEANECLGKKDFAMKIRICRKEAKETIYWLRLLDAGGNEQFESTRGVLIQECTELMKIFGAILEKCK